MPSEGASSIFPRTDWGELQAATEADMKRGLDRLSSAPIGIAVEESS